MGMSRWMFRIWIAAIVLWTTTMLGCVRLFYVTEARRNVLDAVSECSTKDINAKREWRWRFEAFQAVSFDSMLFVPWRSVQSFYADTGFMRCDEASGSTD
jgi:hypothetical protein